MDETWKAWRASEENINLTIFNLGKGKTKVGLTEVWRLEGGGVEEEVSVNIRLTKYGMRKHC